MLLPIPTPRGQTIPAGTPRINWSHPLAFGLKNVWVHDGSNIPVSLTTGLALNQGVKGTTGQSVAGGGFKFDGSTQYDYANSSSISGLNTFSLFTFVTPLVLATSARYFAHANGAGTLPSLALGSDSTTASIARVVFTDNAGTTVNAKSASGTLVAGVPIALGGNFACNSAGSNMLYVNGVKVATTAASAGAPGTTSATTIGAQRFNSAVSSFANCLSHMSAEWNRQLTDAEHEMLGQNPTCFLIYPEDEMAAMLVGNNTTLSSGGASLTSVGSTIATVTVALPSNGTAPYTYQWYRSTTTGFTPGAGNILAGATSRTLNDTGLTNGTTYYYVNKVTDNVAATALSNQTSATPQAVTAGGVTFSGTTASGTTVATTSPTGGTSPYSIQFQRAPDVSGSPGTYANVGTAGIGLTFTDSGLTSGTPYWYRVVVTDSLSATSTGTGSSVTTSGAAPITIGTASLTSTGNGAVSVTSTAASGGVATLTYQWYRSTDASVDGTAVAGATSLTLNDSGLTNGVVYYYKLKATDGSTTATSNQVSGIPAKTYILGLIGDSWNTTTCTSGGSGTVTASAAGNLASERLQSLFGDGTKIIGSNQGVGGTNGNDWAPGGTNMNAAVAAIDALVTSNSLTASGAVVSLHVGINDSSTSFSFPSGTPEPKATYKGYVQSIVTYLLNTKGYGGVVLLGPPNIKDISSNHTAAGVAALATYCAALQEIAIANPSKVYADVTEFAYFTNNQSQLGLDKVHPLPPDANGKGGSEIVATIWARAVYNFLRPVATAAQATIKRYGEMF